MLDLSKPNEDSEIFEEQLYALFYKMRKKANIATDFIYDDNDEYLHSKEFKQGFMVGVNIAKIVLNKKMTD